MGQIVTIQADKISPKDYLFYAGSKTTKSVGGNASDKYIYVQDAGRFKAGYDAMFFDYTNPLDAEHVKIEAVDTNLNRLTVKRGEKGRGEKIPDFSKIKAHPQGTKIAMHVNQPPEANTANSWFLNPNKVHDFLSSYIIQRVQEDKVDGVKIDNANPFPGIPEKNQVDINNDLVPDGMVINNKNLYQAGFIELFRQVRAGLGPDTIIIGNNAAPNPYINGQLVSQGWASNLSQYWSEAMGQYHLHMSSDYKPQFTWLDTETDPFALKAVRFGLAATLMDNGGFNNKGDLAGHPAGFDTWYDEYDNGAGSSLVANADASQKYIDVFPDTGVRFHAGDVVYTMEEIMKVIGVQDDRLIVQRAFVPDYLEQIRTTLNKPTPPAVNHSVGEKIYTMEQVRNGLGYLGKAIDKPVSCPANQGCQRKFDNGIVLVNPTQSDQTFTLTETYYRINGTQVRSVNNGQRVEASLIVPANDGLILVKHINIPSPTRLPSITPPPILTNIPIPSCPRKPLGDANCDGIISGLDYSIWLNSQCRPQFGQVCANIRADFNNDKNIDDADYLIWFENRER